MNIILPNGFENFQNNQNLINIFKQNKNVYIKGVRSAMPFSFFKDEVNYINHNSIFLYKNMIEYVQNYNLLEMHLLDFSNPLIEKKDFYNNYCKLQFELFEKYNNIYFIISNKDFLLYLIDNYPKCKIILSEYFFYSHQDEILNIVNNYHNIKGIISSNLTILNYFNNNLIKILSFDLYNCSTCNYCQQCKSKEQSNILNFSNQSVFFNCESVNLLSLNLVKTFLSQVDNNTLIYFQAPKSNPELYYNYLLNLLEENYD